MLQVQVARDPVTRGEHPARRHDDNDVLRGRATDKEHARARTRAPSSRYKRAYPYVSHAHAVRRPSRHSRARPVLTDVSGLFRAAAVRRDIIVRATATVSVATTPAERPYVLAAPSRWSGERNDLVRRAQLVRLLRLGHRRLW